MKAIVKAVLVVAVILVIIMFSAAGIAYSLNRAPGEENKAEHIFSVEKGESVSSIASRLEELDLIRSKYFLRVLSKLKGTEGSFRAGSYLIQSGATSLAVHNTLVSGIEVMKKVTIPEGLSRTRLAVILDEGGIVAAEEFLEASEDKELLVSFSIKADSAEGFLFPDTYLFPEDYPADRVVKKMIDRFFDVIEDIAPGLDEISGEEMMEKVILASIIEREYVIPEEAPYMASVFYNRLELDMRLQSCATVAYVLSEELGKEYPEKLTLKDLEVASEYNTYRNGGLPPGPIANPGKVALSAVFYPADTEYLYFLLKDRETGSHEFTATYKEHIDAKNLFLKIK